jgi:hypothetical protein
VAQFGGGAPVVCGETTMAGGDSGHLGPIPSTGRKRAAQWSSRRAQRRSGRCRTVALPGGHGGSCGACAEERAREQGREREERGFVASLRVSREAPQRPERQAGGVDGLALRRTRRCLRLKTKAIFQKTPGFGRFSRKKQNSTLLYYLVIQTTLKFSK